jgi:hypothetical protein
MIDLKQFRLNQSRVPLKELAKHNGEYVAWSADGTRILAGDADPQQLETALRAAGFDPGDLLVTFVSVPEEVSWGGCFLPDEAPCS